MRVKQEHNIAFKILKMEGVITMKCYKHGERDATSQCLDCGRALCQECTNRYEQPICDNCNLKRIGNYKKVILRNSILTIIFFVFGFYYYRSMAQNVATSIIGGYIFAGIPWGWSFLSRITPEVFLFLPLIGWIFYFIIKLTLAIFVGLFVTPFKIYQIVKGFIKAKELDAFVKNNVTK